MKFPKPQMCRDKKYLAWLRTQPCCICGAGNTVAHHTSTGGIGLKGSDLLAIPLCPPCHDMIHRHYGKGTLWTEEQLQRIINNLQQKYRMAK